MEKEEPGGTMVGVEITETGLVAPSEETPRYVLWLSNLDLLVARGHTPTVYFYKPNGDPGFFLADAVKSALSKALVPFYPLAGRLGLDRNGRVAINCTGEGVTFVVARSQSTIDDLGGFVPSQKIRELLVPSVDSGNAPCTLVMIQLTYFTCGGVCLGVAVHHTAADGLGALHFINAWSDIARGVATAPAAAPFLDRTLLQARTPPTVLFKHIEYEPKPQTDAAHQKPPFNSAVLKISKNQLDSLKGRGTKGLSTFKAVVAHVWRTACKARRLEGSRETRLYMTADARSRVVPRIPPGYIGNAIFRTSAAATAGEIVSSSLEFGAEKIHEATARLNDGYIRSLIDFLELQEDVRGLTKGRWKMPESDLWVISWQGLPIYEADFGWGKPVYMGRACLQFSGLVYIIHSPDNDGGLMLALALEPESMPRFKKIFYEDLAGI